MTSPKGGTAGPVGGTDEVSMIFGCWKSHLHDHARLVSSVFLRLVFDVHVGGAEHVKTPQT
jgi:hypothetical protein